MNIGMLWQLEKSKKSLEEKILAATEYYHRKYGGTANVCFVHPSTTFGATIEIHGLNVKTSRQVQPGYAWIGVEDE